MGLSSVVSNGNGLNSSDLKEIILRIGHLSTAGEAWFYVGFIANVIFVGIVFFLERATSKATGHMNYKSMYVLSMAAFYYMLLSQIGHDHALEATTIKYCYWMVTTPIILIQLCELLDGVNMITWVVMLDVMTMVTGLVSWLVGTESPLRWLMFGISCLAATFLFSIVLALFVWNFQILTASGYIKERSIYNLIAAIYFPGWLSIVLVWLFGFEGLGLMGEDQMAAAHVLIDILVKDITEVLIVWVSYSLNMRLMELHHKAASGSIGSAMDQSYMHMINSRVPRLRSQFEVMESSRNNTQGILSQVKLPSVSAVGSRKMMQNTLVSKKTSIAHAPLKGTITDVKEEDEDNTNTPTGSTKNVSQV